MSCSSVINSKARSANIKPNVKVKNLFPFKLNFMFITQYYYYYLPPATCYLLWSAALHLYSVAVAHQQHRSPTSLVSCGTTLEAFESADLCSSCPVSPAPMSFTSTDTCSSTPRNYKTITSEAMQFDERDRASEKRRMFHPRRLNDCTRPD